MWSFANARNFLPFLVEVPLAGYLQLKVRINFGPIESPTKTIPLIDLVDNLRVVLAALPFVSQASKEKAIDAMSNTNFDVELPSSEILEKLILKTGIAEHAGRVRDAMFERKDGICSVQATLRPQQLGRSGLPYQQIAVPVSDWSSTSGPIAPRLLVWM